MNTNRVAAVLEQTHSYLIAYELNCVINRWKESCLRPSCLLAAAFQTICSKASSLLEPSLVQRCLKRTFVHHLCLWLLPLTPYRVRAKMQRCSLSYNWEHVATGFSSLFSSQNTLHVIKILNKVVQWPWTTTLLLGQWKHNHGMNQNSFLSPRDSWRVEYILMTAVCFLCAPFRQQLAVKGISPGWKYCRSSR